MKRIVAVFLVLCLLLAGCGETAPVQSGENLMENIRPAKVAVIEEGADGTALTDFGLRLFQASLEPGENTLISPLSVLYALSMTANGAEGNTLSQMEAVLGQPIGVLNSQLAQYRTQLKEGILHLANGIWFKDDPNLTVNELFLQTNGDYYGAGIYKAPFDDSTLKDINWFVEENTDGMIRDILDEIPEEAVMYLVNALSFDAQWQEVYEEFQVREEVFTTESGIQQEVELMFSEEHAYLEDDRAKGFLKYYEGGRYAFAALLPEEGVTVADYVQSLTGEHLKKLLAEPQNVTVQVAIPKFETEFDTEMNEVLKTMGMTDAFDEDLADFSGIGNHLDGNLYINSVLHKTFISVAEQGTRAGAATTVEIACGAAMEPEEIREVILNRPFVYMIVDCETGMPLFMGTRMGDAEGGVPIVLEGPPRLMVSSGGIREEISTSSCSWEYDNPDGEKTAYIGCGAHPLQMQGSVPCVDAVTDTLWLTFSTLPDEVIVQRWSDVHWDDTAAQEEWVEFQDGAVMLKQGGYVYAVNARWEKAAFRGEAVYVFWAGYSPCEESHEPAIVPATCAEPVDGYCGNTQITVFLPNAECTFSGEDAIVLTDLVINLDYDPNAICRCMGEYSVKTEASEVRYVINLTKAFVRCPEGQAPLTEEQVQMIQQIIDKL